MDHFADLNTSREGTGMDVQLSGVLPTYAKWSHASIHALDGRLEVWGSGVPPDNNFSKRMFREDQDFDIPSVLPMHMNLMISYTKVRLSDSHLTRKSEPSGVLPGGDIVYAVAPFVPLP